jgi:hypothetical protein
VSDDELAALEARLDALSRRLEVQEEQTEHLEAELQKRDKRIDELESRLATTENRTDMLDAVEQAAALKPDERAAVLVQTLYNEAANSNGEASIDAGQAVKALGGSVDRTLMYGESGVFQKAVDAVGDEDVLELKTEDRSSKKNTRLRLDLTEGTLPDTVAGLAVAGGAD